MIPYTRGLSKSFKKVCNKIGIQAHFRGNNAICKLLVVPKDKDTIMQKSGVICQFKCTQSGFEEEYIRESGGTFGDRLKEHLRTPSPIYQHSQSTLHQCGQLFHCRQGNAVSYQDHQGGHVH